MKPALAAAALLLGLLAGCEVRIDDAELYRRAADHARKAEHRAAVIDLRNLLQRTPTHADARLLLGESLLALGDYAAADAELNKARSAGASPARVLPALAEALLGEQRFADVAALGDEEIDTPAARQRLAMAVGYAHLSLQNPQQARDAFSRCLEIEPGNLHAQVGVAETLYALDGAASALAAAERVLASNREFVPAWNLIGTLQGREHQRELALAAFRRARELAEKQADTPGKLTALAGVADVQLDAGDAAAALQTTDELLRIAPASHFGLYRRARAKLLLAEYGESRALLEQILSGNPNDSAARLLLGAVNYSEGNLGQADMYLSSVIAQQPQNVFARRLLAETRARANRPREALDALGPIAADDVESEALAGRIALRGGDPEEGVRRLEKAAEAAPADAQRRLELAAAYLAHGQLDRGLRLLEALPPSSRAPDRREYLMLLAKGRQQDWPGALKLSRDLIAQFPRSTPLYLLQAQFQAADRQIPEARASLARALEIEPESPGIHVARGDFELQQGDLGAAASSFAKAAQLAPESGVAQAGLARVALAKGDAAAAISQLEAAVKEHPQAAMPRLMLGQILLAQRAFPRAYEQAQALVKLAPDDPAALDLLAQSGARVGQASQMLASVTEAANRNPRSAAHHFASARAHMLTGNVQQAQQAARAALDVDAEYVPALALMTELMLQQQRPQQAAEYFARLEKLEPSALGTLALRGDLALARRDFAAARTAYRKALALRPLRTLLLKEYHARQQARDGAALDSLREWLAAHPRDTVVRLALADAQMRAGERDHATREYETVLAQNAADVVALNNLAWIYFEANDARALPLAQRAYERAPHSADVADTYGWVMLETGDARRALEVLQAAHAASPRSREIRYHLAVALHRNGNAGESRRLLETLLADERPFAGSDGARQLLERLRQPAS